MVHEEYSKNKRPACEVCDVIGTPSLLSFFVCQFYMTRISDGDSNFLDMTMERSGKKSVEHSGYGVRMKICT